MTATIAQVTGSTGFYQAPALMKGEEGTPYLHFGNSYQAPRLSTSTSPTPFASILVNWPTSGRAQTPFLLSPLALAHRSGAIWLVVWWLAALAPPLPIAADPGTPVRAPLKRFVATASMPVTSKTVPFAGQVIEDLRGWLGYGMDEAAALIGVSRGTAFAWIRNDVRPHSATLRRALRVHTLIRALVERHGAAMAASWARAGSPSPETLLRAGDLAAAENAARNILFAEVRPLADDGSVIQIDVPEVDAGIPHRAAPYHRATIAVRRSGHADR